MTKFMNTLTVVVLVVLGLSALVGVGIAVHLSWTQEPVFLDDAIQWERDEFPLRVCAEDRRPGFSAEGALTHAIQTTNDRLGFLAYVRDETDECQVMVTFGMPAEAGMRDPGGDAVWTEGVNHCSVGISNVHGELETLTLQHELGHCLGLTHDDFRRSIMFGGEGVGLQQTPDRTIPPWITDVDRQRLRERYLGD